MPPGHPQGWHCSTQQQEEHGRVEESTRQNLVMAFNNVLRTSSLVGVVDFQRAALAFGSLLESSSGSELPLAPLYDFLIEQGGPQPAVVEVIVFLKSRESRFGLQMALPPGLATLSPEEREAIVTTFTNRGASSGTRSGARGPNSVTGTQNRTQSGPVIVPASTTMPSSGTTGTTPRNIADAPPVHVGPSRKQILGVVSVVVVVLGIVNAVYLFAGQEPPPQRLEFTDPSGLPCVDALANKGTVICRLPNSFLTSTSPAALDARGAVSKTFAATRGFTRILVMSQEDNKVRKVY